MTEFEEEELLYFDQVRRGNEPLSRMIPSIRVRYDMWLKENNFVATTINRSGDTKKSVQDVYNEYEGNKCEIPITDLTAEEVGMFYCGFYPIKYSEPDENGHRDKIQDTETWMKFRPNFQPTEDHPYIGWSQHEYLLTWDEAKTCDGFNGVIKDNFCLIDFDAHNPEKEPLYKNDILADAKMFVRLLNNKHLNTMVVKTNNGFHAYFRNDQHDVKTGAGLYTPTNMRVDYRANGTGSVCLKINGQPRTVVYKPRPSQNQPIRIDEIPIYLKSCSKSPLLGADYIFPLKLDTLTNREITFRNYILKLINFGYKDSEITQIILAINCTLKSPLMERELNEKLLIPRKLKEARKVAKQVTERKPEEYLKENQTEFTASIAQGICEKEICRAVKKFNSLHKNSKFVGLKKNRGVYEIIVGENGNFHELPMTPASLSGLVTTEEFVWSNGKVLEDGTHEYALPSQVAFRGIIESQGYNSDLPMYKRVFSGAFLTPEGRIVNKQGLDEETGVYLLNDIEVPEIPENPTWDDVQQVRDMFAEIFRDFQFEGDEEDINDNPNYNNLILALALAVFRLTIPNAYPIVCINKSSERSGASLLCSVMSRMAHNREASSVSLSEDNVQEAEKQINSMILENNPITVLDNITNRTKTNYSSLLSVSSGDGTFKVRPLGSSATVECEKDIMVIMNGIKVSVSADLCARIIQVSLSLRSSWQKASFSRSKMELLDIASEMHAKTIYGIGVFLKYWKNLGEPIMPSVGVNLSEYLDLYNFVGSMLYSCGYKEILKNSLEISSQENEKDVTGSRFIEIFYKKFNVREITIDEIMAICLNERMQRSVCSYDADSYGTRQNYKYSEDLVTLLFTSREVKDLESIDASVVGRRMGRYVDIAYDNAKYKLQKKRTKQGVVYYLQEVRT